MYASRAALVSGEYEKALALAIELYPLVLSLDSPFGIGMGILRKALALHFLGKCNDAEEVLPEIHEIARTHDSRWLRMFALYHEAYFAFDAGDTDRGTETLRESLGLAKESGYAYCTDDHPDITARLCLKAIEKGIEADYAGEIIRRRGLMPPPEGENDPVSLEEWPYPLKIYTLGRFEIVRDGVPLVFSGKVQKKPLEMLKAIVAMGGTHVPVVRLTDALWPDAEGDMAHNAFEVTLSRLRKLLSCGDIITFSAGQIGIDGKRCRVDSMVLESEIDAAEAADGEKSSEHCVRALRLYSGPFLPSDEGAPWASARRVFLHDAMLRIMMRAGRYHESRGNVEQALDIYSRGIATDNLAEAFYQRRMICLRELGYRAEAVKTFHTCRRMLKAHLGLEPSKTTRAVFDSLAD
jgi:DNA-binding SARP family transcriptional activator